MVVNVRLKFLSQIQSYLEHVRVKEFKNQSAFAKVTTKNRRNRFY